MLELLNQINKQMQKISLKTITDDILLLVRNNNISESEDLSRAQIHSWVKAYKHALWKEESDRKKDLARQNQLDDLFMDDEYLKLVETDHELEPVEANTSPYIIIKRTVDTLDGLLDNNPANVLAIHDANGENIQYMNHVRRYYNYWRRYTFGDMTASYRDDGHVYIQGLTDKNLLNYVSILWIKEVEEDDLDEANEEDVMIPGWMVPKIKELILKNELAFMLNRPSDDSNNATLASVKPHGPQDEEE